MASITRPRNYGTKKGGTSIPPDIEIIENLNRDFEGLTPPPAKPVSHSKRTRSRSPSPVPEDPANMVIADSRNNEDNKRQKASLQNSSPTSSSSGPPVGGAAPCDADDHSTIPDQESSRVPTDTNEILTTDPPRYTSDEKGK